jgi:hypothetical protein
MFDRRRRGRLPNDATSAGINAGHFRFRAKPEAATKLLTQFTSLYQISACPTTLIDPRVALLHLAISVHRYLKTLEILDLGPYSRHDT